MTECEVNIKFNYYTYSRKKKKKQTKLQRLCINFQLCQARGFVCELCNSSEIIYPWELNKVTRCDGCGTCYHLKCLNPKYNSKRLDCKRCSRLKARRESIIEETEVCLT